MKRLLLFIVGMSLLFSCEYLNGPTTINKEITAEYLLQGNLDVYLSNNQVFRYKGKPGIENIKIGNDNLSDFQDCFKMYIASGTTPATTVSSAIIKLDGLDVLNTSDFSKNFGEHMFEICNLTSTSVITVEVRGEPGSFIEIWIEGKKKELTVTDCDGNIYKTVKIGDQVWMAENLKTTNYNDCTPIGAGCTFYNNDPSNKDVYGALYTNNVVSTGKLCPTGWHAPSENEFKTLLLTLDPGAGNIYDLNGNAFKSLIAGNMLKEAGSAHWSSENEATNESGFTALGAGIRHKFGDFRALGTQARFWSMRPSTIGVFLELHSWEGKALLLEDVSASGFSVRCVKDN